MEVELRFFATFREAVGRKTVYRRYDAGATVGEVLQSMTAEHPDLDLFEDDGSLRDFATVMKNGRQVIHLDGLATELGDGDVLSVFPPVAGG
ncbi:MAG: ubiquitin-like small modifier protein 1 [Halobacteriales archaeon]